MMRVDLHNICDIHVDITKSSYDKSGWFTISFDTKGYYEEEAKRSDDQITIFIGHQTDIEDVTTALSNRIQAAIVQARKDHAEKEAARAEREAEEAKA